MDLPNPADRSGPLVFRVRARKTKATRRGHRRAVTKRYDEDIEVTSEPRAGIPIAFSWRGRRYDVDQSHATWSEAWTDECDRSFFRVLAHPRGALCDGAVDPDGFLMTKGAVYDLYLDQLRGAWRLARVWD